MRTVSPISNSTQRLPPGYVRARPSINCHECRKAMEYVGKLPGIADRPTLLVFKCKPCLLVVDIE